MSWRMSPLFTFLKLNEDIYRQAVVAMFPHLTHWGRVTHICVGNLTTIGPDNGLSPGRRQAIIWTNAGILLIGPCGTNFSEIIIGIQTFSFKKMHLKMPSGKWRPFCLGLNVLIYAIHNVAMFSCTDSKHCEKSTVPPDGDRLQTQWWKGPVYVHILGWHINGKYQAWLTRYSSPEKPKHSGLLIRFFG